MNEDDEETKAFYAEFCREMAKVINSPGFRLGPVVVPDRFKKDEEGIWRDAKTGDIYYFKGHEPAKVDLSRYPKTCPSCSSPAYQSPVSGWDCSSGSCRNHR